MRWLLSLAALKAVILLGCADGTRLAARPVNDPANPAAPEGVVPPPEAGSATPPKPVDAPPVHHHQHGGTPGTCALSSPCRRCARPAARSRRRPAFPTWPPP